MRFYTARMNDTLQTADGIALHVRRWLLSPLTQPARGTVLIVHGLGEHIGRYPHVAAHLNAWGWNVVGFDQRGHGLSGGARGRLAAADSLLQDLSQVIDAVRAEHSGPLVLLGHSMGGLVAARFVAEGLLASPAPWHRAVDALVLSSPALDAGMSGAQKLLLAEESRRFSNRSKSLLNGPNRFSPPGLAHYGRLQPLSGGPAMGQGASGD